LQAQKLKKYEFVLEAPTEVQSVVEEVAKLRHRHMTGFIYSYIHNTVIVQSLKREINKKVPALRLFFLKHSAKRGAKFVLFGYDEEPFEGNLEAEIISILDTECEQKKAELQECKRDLIKKYFHDHLTNIPNIYKLRKDLQECHDVTLLDITVDDFKSINSFYGFFVGDYVLEQLAIYLKEIPDATVYKMPGGEFILLLQTHYSYYDLKE